MTTQYLVKMFKNASLLEIDAQKLYILAKTTGEVDRVPDTAEIIQFHDWDDESGYQIVAMNHYFVAVNIWDFSLKEPKCEFYIFENGILITVQTKDNEDFDTNFSIIYGA